MEAEYLAVSFALSEVVNKHNKELDTRDQDLDVERTKATGEETFSRVSSAADRTARPKLPPIEIRSDNQVVVNQLSRRYHIGADNLRKRAEQIWAQCKNLDVRFVWIPREQNLAGKMLK